MEHNRGVTEPSSDRSRWPFLAHLVVPAALLAWVAWVAQRALVLNGAWRTLGLIGGLWLATGLGLLASPRGRAWGARHGKGLLGGTVMLVLMVLVAEGALRYRWWGSLRAPSSGEERGHRFDHPRLGWANPPGARWTSSSGEFHQQIEVNSAGFHDIEHERARPAGTFRIVVLGDSFMEAAEVALEEVFARQLEGQLTDRGIEVINLGVRAYGTAQELRTLEDVGLAYAPDLVLLAFFTGNDTRNNSRWLEVNTWGLSAYTCGRPYAVLDPQTGELAWTEPDLEQVARMRSRTKRSLLLEHLPVPPFLRPRRVPGPRDERLLDRWNENVALIDFAVSFDPALGRDHIEPEEYRRRFDEGWAVTVRLLAEIRERSAAAGASAVMMVVPTGAMVGERVIDEIEGSTMQIDLSLPSRRLVEAASVHGMPIVDLTAPMRAARGAGQGRFYFPEDGHWTPEGHAFAARTVAAFLEREGLLGP